MSASPRSASLLLWTAAPSLAALWLIPASTAWRLAPDLGHAWAVPVLIAYLWWERWAERPALFPTSRPPSRFATIVLGTLLLLAVLELPLRLLLTPFPLWPALLAAFTLLLAGIALGGAWLLAGRPAVWWLGGPLILLLSALPLPSLAENKIILPLRTAMATLATEISNLLGYPALAMGTSIRLGGGWVGIDEACGGIRSLQACVMIGLFFGEWYRFRWGRRVLLLAAAIGCALVGNFARVLTLSLLAHSGPEAIEQAHDPAGWLAMGFSLALTGWLACRWAGYRWPERRLSSVASAEPAAPASSLAAATSLVGVIALLALNEAGNWAWFAHGERERASVPRWTAHFPVDTPSDLPQPLAHAAREMLQPDYYIAGRWRLARDTYAAAYYVEWRHGQLARSIPFLHNPTVCLPYAGCELMETLPTFTISTSAGEVPFFAYRFRRASEELFVAFTIWDTDRGRPLQKPEETEGKTAWWATQWAEVAQARRHQPAQLLSVTIPFSPDAQKAALMLLQQLNTSSNSSN